MKMMLKELLAHILGPDFRYPVGSYYETSDANFDPNIAWGGTWVLEDGGRVHISSGLNIANTTNYWGTLSANELNFPLGERGGEHSHTLTVNEMPSHEHEVKWEHSYNVSLNKGSSGYGYALNWGVPEGSGRLYGANTGGGQPHHNIQPYTVVNRWHRTA